MYLVKGIVIVGFFSTVAFGNYIKGFHCNTHFIFNNIYVLKYLNCPGLCAGCIWDGTKGRLTHKNIVNFDV